MGPGPLIPLDVSRTNVTGGCDSPGIVQPQAHLGVQWGDSARARRNPVFSNDATSFWGPPAHRKGLPGRFHTTTGYDHRNGAVLIC
jgi:hypothetical protein